MICKHCGTNIAAKALICYRCGASTADPVPVRSGGGRGSRPSLVVGTLVLVILLVAGLYMGRAAQGDASRLLGLVLAGLAAAAIVWNLIRRK